MSLSLSTSSAFALEAPDKVLFHFRVGKVTWETGGSPPYPLPNASHDFGSYQKISEEIQAIVGDATIKYMVKVCHKYSTSNVKFPHAIWSSALGAPRGDPTTVLTVEPLDARDLQSCLDHLAEAADNKLRKLHAEIQNLSSVTDDYSSLSCSNPFVLLKTVLPRKQGSRQVLSEEQVKCVQVGFSWNIIWNRRVDDQAGLVSRAVAKVESYAKVRDGQGVPVGAPWHKTSTDMETWGIRSTRDNGIDLNTGVGMLCFDTSENGFLEVLSTTPMGGTTVESWIQQVATSQANLSGSFDSGRVGPPSMSYDW
ncbi:hypothetical protein QFC21_000692 [Naganishia friedmannii]|uniref:Uncharacterized protein n=1 Tax=Naganishia friedmannii TaxID=89922 RepID=A0ACC2WE64_9TREE|nr:hypothetical protein QFC21_000692 [Naganishia friedmannii]